MSLQVVTVAKFQGGGAFNVIPDSVTIGGTFRAFSQESFKQLRQRIEQVCPIECESIYMVEIRLMNSISYYIITF